jgi:Ala-tRNA(Pro) deacylase
MGLTPGAVGPFGLIFDQYREVEVVIYRKVAESEWVTFHPTINTASVTIRYKDLERFLAWCGYKVVVIDQVSTI